ncbi:uncharacterized protein MKK02DRAFT_28517 [Dioszegia hungarica]|uniref:Uncharacterized protein n=1 Tax=Dioszegia hungarica TaxID=4972 RepID=A0AA38H434_9TREE|nr:uncharacterized protein MKK02DRAFT_28517 [Dioszegia hungarica]KAI9633743.1 hypothetical protein MKK02DRAFT_28517 [Dioszegia hungarica]
MRNSTPSSQPSLGEAEDRPASQFVDLAYSGSTVAPVHTTQDELKLALHKGPKEVGEAKFTRRKTNAETKRQQRLRETKELSDLTQQLAWWKERSRTHPDWKLYDGCGTCVRGATTQIRPGWPIRIQASCDQSQWHPVIGGYVFDPSAILVWSVCSKADEMERSAASTTDARPLWGAIGRSQSLHAGTSAVVQSRGGPASFVPPQVTYNTMTREQKKVYDQEAQARCTQKKTRKLNELKEELRSYEQKDARCKLFSSEWRNWIESELGPVAHGVPLQIDVMEGAVPNSLSTLYPYRSFDLVVSPVEHDLLDHRNYQPQREPDTKSTPLISEGGQSIWTAPGPTLDNADRDLARKMKQRQYTETHLSRQGVMCGFYQRLQECALRYDSAIVTDTIVPVPFAAKTHMADDIEQDRYSIAPGQGPNPRVTGATSPGQKINFKKHGVKQMATKFCEELRLGLASHGSMLVHCDTAGRLTSTHPMEGADSAVDHSLQLATPL